MPERESRLHRKRALPVGVVRRVSERQVAKIYQQYAEAFPHDPGDRVLDLGVESAAPSRDPFFFESRYPYPHNVTACGFEPASLLSRYHPDTRYVQISRARALPFPDGSFSLVFCHGLIERVGDRGAQRNLLEEIFRVGLNAFVTTSNRWHPIELHTMLPLIHYLPAPLHRKLLLFLGFDLEAKEENVNLLSRGSFSQLVPTAQKENCRIGSSSLFGLPAHLILVWRGFRRPLDRDVER